MVRMHGPESDYDRGRVPAGSFRDLEGSLRVAKPKTKARLLCLFLPVRSNVRRNLYFGLRLD
jgi:hypothetical protein